MTGAGCSAFACSSQNPRTHPPRPGGAGRTGSQAQYNSRPRRMTEGVKSGACSGCSTRRRRAGSQPSFAQCSRANDRSCRSASVDWVASAARRADDPRQALLRARTGAGLAAHSASSTLTDPMASSGEPLSGGLPTLCGSWATTNIGARSDARPRSLSAVLENECANPTHDRVAAFRQIRASRAIAQDLVVVRLLTYAWRGSLRTCGFGFGEGAIGSPGCSGVVGHRLPAKSRRC